MKVSLQYPSIHQLTAFLEVKQQAPFSYEEQNGTQIERVEGYDNDLTSTVLGQGDSVWLKAKEALNGWNQFPSSWTKIHKDNTPLKTGNTVAVLFKLFGLWWLNSARIVYVFDEADRYGFAYGTLEGHVERGEECFWIDRDAAGNVSYHIKAFSKPDFWGARLTYPMSRMFQRKFVRDSMNDMKRLSNS